MRKVYPINSVYISYAALATSTLVKQYWIYSKQLLCIWNKLAFKYRQSFSSPQPCLKLETGLWPQILDFRPSVQNIHLVLFKIIVLFVSGFLGHGRVLKHQERVVRCLAGMQLQDSRETFKNSKSSLLCPFTFRVSPLKQLISDSKVTIIRAVQHQKCLRLQFSDITWASLEKSLHIKKLCTSTSYRTTSNNINQNTSRKHWLDDCRRNPFAHPLCCLLFA